MLSSSNPDWPTRPIQSTIPNEATSLSDRRYRSTCFRCRRPLLVAKTYSPTKYWRTRDCADEVGGRGAEDRAPASARSCIPASYAYCSETAVETTLAKRSRGPFVLERPKRGKCRVAVENANDAAFDVVAETAHTSISRVPVDSDDNLDEDRNRVPYFALSAVADAADKPPMPLMKPIPPTLELTPVDAVAVAIARPRAMYQRSESSPEPTMNDPNEPRSQLEATRKRAVLIDHLSTPFRRKL